MNQELTDAEKNIMFKGATEPAFSGTLLDEKRDGAFYCKNCNHLLFESDTKFDSGSGWPSFTEPANTQNVTLHNDVSIGMNRVEVGCANCQAHLGHVFPDGPIDRGGDRYCINSACLIFTPKDEK